MPSSVAGRIRSRRRRALRALRVEPGGLADRASPHPGHGAPSAPDAATAPLGGDLAAGVVVFLVALPLCLGVALASGAPLLSGVVTGVVGGVLVSWLSGSQLMVSGPAAGLSAIVLASIAQLGSFHALLVAIVLAGAIQVALGLLRAGVIGYYLPSSVIKGMLAAIGIILILKQVPYALGVGLDVFGSHSFSQASGGNTFTGLATALRNVHPGALVLSALALLVLFGWDHPRLGALKRRAPAALVVVLVGVLGNLLFARLAPTLAIPGEGLVQLPAGGAVALDTYLAFPDWSVLRDPAVYRIAVTIALVATLETLLSLEATDKLDPYKRSAPPDRELLAQGAGNIVCGLVGGLPMTGVVVRSAANVAAGGRTRRASFTHGVILAGAVLAIPGLLNRIPLAVLATVLVYTGFKLTHPRVVLELVRLGWTQFLPFAVTVVAIILTDLLQGILIGLGVGVFFILRTHYRTAYFCHRDESADRHTVRIQLAEDISFLNKASLLRLLGELPHESVVTVDGSRSQHIDHDVLEILRDFRQTAQTRSIDFRLVGIAQQ
jgi:MFS superfamily sulfate permease-like transporter